MQDLRELVEVFSILASIGSLALTLNYFKPFLLVFQCL